MKRNSTLLTPLVLLTGVIARADHDENDVYVLTRPERTIEAVEKAYASMPPLKYAPPASRWRSLPRTRAILAKGTGELRVVMLGDSIVNDTSRSRWDDVLQRQYPGAKISKVTCVRGGTGCWWFKPPERIRRYILDHRPDLLIVGGISHNNDIESVAALIEQVRSGSDCDILLLTPVFGLVDPRDDRQWQVTPDPSGQDFRSRLIRLAGERRVAVLDMSSPWGRYVRESGEDIRKFKRDEVHANERGEQLIGRILATYLGPPVAPSP